MMMLFRMKKKPVAGCCFGTVLMLSGMLGGGGFEEIRSGAVLRTVFQANVARAESTENDAPENTEGSSAGNGSGQRTQNTAEEKTSGSKQMKQMLKGLEEKRRQIESRRAALKAEEKRLEKLKQEIEEKIESLAKIQKEVETRLARLEKKKTEKQKQQEVAEAAKIKQLVKAYSAMKPRKAAAIINNMDIETAKKILLNMKGDQAGVILSYVNSDHAARISQSLAFKPENNKS